MTTNGHAPPRAPTPLRKEEHVATSWFIDLDEHARLTGEDITFEDTLKPVFWSRNVDRIKVGDLLRVHKDGEIDCRLIATWIGPHGVGVKVFGAAVGSPFYNELKAIETAQREKNRAALAASVAPSQEATP
jgi:hypothetical protein